MTPEITTARRWAAISTFGLLFLGLNTAACLLFALFENKPKLLLIFCLGVLETAFFAWFYIDTRRKLKRARRKARGACLHCGYDLRHSPHRCPECGQTPSTSIPPSGAPVR